MVAVTLISNRDIEIELYNIYGQLIKNIYKGKVSSKKLNVTSDISELSGGLYFIKLSGGGNIVKRFVKL